MVEKLKVEFPITIVGLGVSGSAILRLFLAAGVPREQISTFDNKVPADFQDSALLLSKFKPKTLVVSPGFPLSTPWIKNFSGKITSELTLASRFLTSEKIIAITGSLGKSTTVSLLGEGVKSFSKNYFYGGNLGTPLADYAVGLLQSKTPADWIILELSSYQLENYENIVSDFSAITFLTPNHMDRYTSLEDYYQTKWSLVKKTRGLVVVNGQSSDLIAFATKQKANSCITITDRFAAPEEICLLGTHNKDNYAVAKKIAQLARWPETAIAAMKKFGGLPHRLENLGTLDGVLFVNDSKATTIESVKTAVLSLSPKGKIHLLLGGRDKNLPWEKLSYLSSIKNLQVYFFGECRDVAKEKSLLTGSLFSHLDGAVWAAKNSAKVGDIILLSPGGTSFDQYLNFEERGKAFKRLCFQGLADGA